MDELIFKNEMSIKSLGNGGNAALVQKVSLINIKGNYLGGACNQ